METTKMKNEPVVKITFSIPHKTLNRLDALASQTGRTRSGCIRWLVEQEFRRLVEHFPTLAEVDAAKAEQPQKVG
jgi:predicted DNA-binding protein